ncbi:hypothetical protein DE146DRAFT_672886 [Phaeosphaeria sp. MPI-PUGE-AT-0046c]|nr:hypothetical protein DE146DRAFT_672886 [Phaeosphaeria sp. MPI-PUGE-AT-0046c]
MVHQLVQPCGLLTFVTRWYQILKQTDGQTNFGDWIARQAACSQLPMFGMPQTMLMFIEQAGHQMLGRTQLLESLPYPDGIATASVFFLVQTVDTTLCPLSITYEEHPTLSWWPGLHSNKPSVLRYMPAQMQNLQTGALANKGHCAECIFIWRVAVRIAERSQVRTVSVTNEDLWDYLGLEKRWPIFDNGERDVIDDPFDEGL